MGTFTCFGCGKSMDMAEYGKHKKECGKFGRRDCVMETPVLPAEKDDYMRREDIRTLARESEFKEKWGEWIENK